ncbi:DegT/DnrJ/EryC1/StrS family aminotransferase [Parasphingorhabdus sp.]
MESVSRVIETGKVNYWTGQEGRRFETEFAKLCGVNQAVALANGTLALDLALKALGIGPGDEVIVTPRTFIASVSSVVNAGAAPVFADVNRDSGNIDPTTIEAVISKKTKAMIPVHLAGWPCDMAGITALAKAHRLYVIEDCAQAHGAKIGDKMVGSMGDIGAWSFCQDKIMSTGGEGGMVTTNSENLWSKMWSYKDHGKSWDAVYNREHQPGFRWLHESFGTNWRMLEVQAAIGRIQIERLEDWTKRRNLIARAISQKLEHFSDAVRVPKPDHNATHAYYRLYAYVKPQGLKSGWHRDRIVAEINEIGFPAFQGSCSEVYMEKAFDDTGFRPSRRLPVARELGETSLMFLTHPTITDKDLDAYCNAIEQVMERASA